MNAEYCSDAEWYCREDADRDLCYAIFFKYLRKYDISWDRATDKERAFIWELTRLEYEKTMARRKGLPEDSVKGFFVA